MVGPHREKAVAVLYVQKCAKIEARFADFSYCTEEIPALLGNDTITKVLGREVYVVLKANILIL